MGALFDALAPLDAAAAQALSAALAPGATEWLRLVSALHAPRGTALLLLAGCAWRLARRDRAGAAWLALSVASGALLTHGLKHLLQRPRPGHEGLGLVTDYAFPSGHATQAALLWGALLVLVLRETRSWPARISATALAVLLALLVALSRVALGAHHLSDVLAGLLLGAGWVALCAWLRRARR